MHSGMSKEKKNQSSDFQVFLEERVLVLKALCLHHTDPVFASNLLYQILWSIFVTVQKLSIFRQPDNKAG